MTLGAVGCVCVAYTVPGATWVPNFVSAIGLSSLPIHRILALLGFPVAVLAGIGCDIVVKRFAEKGVRAALATATAAVALCIGFLWTAVGDPGLSTLERSLRRQSLVWPTATIALLVVIWAVTVLARRLAPAARRQLGATIGAVLVASQAAFLLFAGVGIYSYTKDMFPVTADVATLQRIVGTHLVAADAPNVSCANPRPGRVGKPCGFRLWLGVGFIPNMQLGYQIDELGMHDPTIPASYFTAWPVPDAGQSYSGNLQFFSPSIDTVALAHRYGVSYVLVGPKLAVPAGMEPVARLLISGGYLVLAKVPGSARFSFLAPPATACVLGSSHPGDASYRLRVRVDTPTKLGAAGHLPAGLARHRRRPPTRRPPRRGERLRRHRAKGHAHGRRPLLAPRPQLGDHARARGAAGARAGAVRRDLPAARRHGAGVGPASVRGPAGRSHEPAATSEA